MFKKLLAGLVLAVCVEHALPQDSDSLNDDDGTAIEQPLALKDNDFVYEPLDMEEASNDVISAALECAPQILLRFSKKISSNDVKKLAMTLANYRLARSYSYNVQKEGKSSVVVLCPNYMSCVKMIRAIHDPKSITLSPKETEALSRAQEIIRTLNLDNLTNTAKAHVIHDWLVANCAYDVPGLKRGFRVYKDSESYSPYDGKYMILEQKGVCDSYAQAYWLLLQMSGVPSCMIFGASKKGSQRHCWNLVYLDDHWGHIDVTWDDPIPDVPDRVVDWYFDLSDKEMAKTHKWNKNLFSAEHKVLHFDHVEDFVAFLRKQKKKESSYTITIANAQERENFDEIVAQEAQKLGVRESIFSAADVFFPGALHVRIQRKRSK